MLKSLKSVIFFILPIAAVLFFKAEKTRLSAEHCKISNVDQNSNVSSVYDDDTISLQDIDDDEDDSSESLVRLLPAISTSISYEVLHPYKSETALRFSFEDSYKEISQSFLKVFRI